MSQGEPLGNLQQILMLAVVRLGPDAYGVRLQQEIENRLQRRITLSTIYITMNRLEERGLVGSELGDPTPVRGGKAKRLYRLTDRGREALLAARQQLDQMWRGLEPELLPEGS